MSAQKIELHEGRRARRSRRRQSAKEWKALGRTWQRIGMRLGEVGVAAGVEGLRATAAALSTLANDLRERADARADDAHDDRRSDPPA